MRLASEGAFAGAVLDAGCGTGENALRIASSGLPVLGVDVAETAVAVARETAGERGIEAEFAVAVSEEELRAAFGRVSGWNVTAIEPDRIGTRYHDDGAPAWLARIERI